MATSATRDFNGSNTRVESGEVSTFSFTTQDFTVGAWINKDDLVGNEAIISNRVGGGSGWAFRFDGANLELDKIGKSGEGTTTLSFSTDTWYFVAAVIDVDTDIVFYQMTEAGVLSSETEANTDTINTSANDLWIGHANDGSEGRFNGQLAHAQVWSGLLTAAQIQEAAFKPGSVKQNLLGYWPLWGASTTEPDLGPSGFDGTVIGTDTAALDHPKNIIIKGS